MSSNQTTPYTFPAPIGGVPFDSDFIPSIIFAATYAVISFVGVYRLVRPRSRTICTMGTFIFVVERIVIYALRAKQAHTPSEDNSTFLTRYWQTTYAIGYLTIFHDSTSILRSLLVTTTIGVTPGGSDAESSYSLLKEGGAYGLPQEEDQPRARTWYRRICFNLTLASWIPVIMGAIAGFNYPESETNAKTANLVFTLRYAASGIAFGQIAIVQGLSLWAYFCVPRIRRSGALTMAGITTLLNIVSVYRLVVMRLKTTSLTSLGPHSLNDPTSKTMFYIFQAGFELLAAAILLGINVREMFGTGLFGDRSLKKKK